MQIICSVKNTYFYLDLIRNNDNQYTSDLILTETRQAHLELPPKVTPTGHLGLREENLNRKWEILPF